MTSSHAPTICIQHRSCDPTIYQQAIDEGLSSLTARLLAQRLDSTDLAQSSSKQLHFWVQPQLKHLQHPRDLKNIDQAAELIARAVQSDGLIVLATDYDTDGVTSAWVGYQSLTQYFGVKPERVVCIISERADGYGLTQELCERISALKQPIDLVISADQGSSDEAQIAYLAARGIAVCVTDHHQIPVAGPPVSAASIVNPQLEGCEYDKHICGCFVLFLVMSKVRQTLIDQGVLNSDAANLRALLHQVALGTIADSVSLKSLNNRAVVKAGLLQMNQFNHPIWQAVQQAHPQKPSQLTAEFIAFQIASRINAASRVNDVQNAFRFINAQNLAEALDAYTQLDRDNALRQQQQQQMMAEAIQQAQDQLIENPFCIVIALAGNPGIQGIIAARIGERYGLPCIALTQLSEDEYAGSGRAIVEDVNLISAFNSMAEQHPCLFNTKGGHKAAVGCQIPASHLELFRREINLQIAKQLGNERPKLTLYSDGELTSEQLHLTTFDDIDALEPYGRDWPSPRFDGVFEVVSWRCVGKASQHLSLKLRLDDNTNQINAIFFNPSEQILTQFLTLKETEQPKIHCLYQLQRNEFMGRTQLQLRLDFLRLI
ncbi:DHH family phosphoesterase [Thiomicrospira sp. ALE5]|uniref:single-stranded-DNA-specific exonuclease RecJ n=1 Tax=Thiomicrospira sp. ALE5 TaxID=748650 RepID=UPI0008E55F96|nr:DHH family phosphoesterase [Thiomicrospira sp. ALE5]SFR50366.1 single-stranded-DNA-specific exonuclease [Thiomicrospira sp. ALE5]